MNDVLISKQELLNKLDELDQQELYLPCHLKKFVIDEVLSSQPHIVTCANCNYAHPTVDETCKYCDMWGNRKKLYLDGDFYCGFAERKNDE